MENNLKYWENRFSFMIEEKAKNSWIYLGSNDEFQIKHRPNGVLKPCNLNYIVSQISLLNGINKDNIHLYVDFLEKKDIRQIIIQFEDEYSNNINEDIMDIIDILENRLQNL